MPDLFEFTNYARDILLLNISFFAAVYGRIVRTINFPFRIKLRNLTNEKERLNKLITKFFFKDGIKVTIIPFGVVLLNLMYTFVYFLISERGIREALSAFVFVFRDAGIVFVIATLSSMFLIYIFALKPDRDRSLPSAIEEEYIKFSNNIEKNGHLLFAVGDLSFLGKITYINGLDERNKRDCQKAYETEYKCSLAKCKNQRDKCVFRQEQFLNLLKLQKEKNIHVRFLIRRPTSDNDNDFRALLGMLLTIFNDRIAVGFYKDDEMSKELKLYTMIKKQSGGKIKSMLWNWRNDDGTHSAVEELKNGTPEGDTYIYLYDKLLWEKAEKMGDAEKNDCIDKYRCYIHEVIHVR